jgi:hypothetical protein
VSGATCCGVRLTPGLCCIVCMGDPEIRARNAGAWAEQGEKGWSLGYRLPAGREARVVAEWDSNDYLRGE